LLGADTGDPAASGLAVSGHDRSDVEGAMFNESIRHSGIALQACRQLQRIIAARMQEL
jgi:hypothetical protein